jgi:hypothetical protein
MKEDDPARRYAESNKEGLDEQLPPAGPHAKPSLTNPDVTPGTGTLPSGKPMIQTRSRRARLPVKSAKPPGVTILRSLLARADGDRIGRLIAV